MSNTLPLIEYKVLIPIKIGKLILEIGDILLLTPEESRKYKPGQLKRCPN